MSFYKKVLLYIFLGFSCSVWSYEQLTMPNQMSAAHAYIDAGLYENAVQSLRKVNPTSNRQVSEIDYAMGKIYLGINQPQKSLPFFEQVLLDAPNHYQSLVGMANAKIKLGEIKEAKLYLAKASKFSGAIYEVSYLESLIDDLTGNSVGADQRLIRLMKDRAQEDMPVVNYSKLLVQRGQVHEAINLLSKELESKSQSAHIKSVLADALFMAKQKKSAIEYKKQAIRLYISKGDYESAQTSILILKKNAPEVQSKPLMVKKNDAADNLDKKSLAERKSSASNPNIDSKRGKANNIDVEDSENLDPVPFARAIIDQKRFAEIHSIDVPKKSNELPFKPGTSISGGSGVVIDEGRKVITNRHVVEGGKDFVIRNGLGGTSKANVVFVSKTDDIAILELSDPFRAEDAIHESQFKEAKAGSDVVVMGYPLWHLLGRSTPSITNGVVAKATGINDDPTNFQLTAKVNKGNSGGPVFDMYGNLIGITQGKLDTEVIKSAGGPAPEDINFAIHIQRVSKMLKLKKAEQPKNRQLTPVKSEDLYQEMIGKVVMVAVATD